MGDMRCMKLAMHLEEKCQSLNQVKSKIKALRLNPNTERVYYGKLNDETLEFIKSHPYMRRVQSHDAENGVGNLCKMIANDLLMELAYG